MRSITQAGEAVTFTLDAAGRRARADTSNSSTTTRTVVRHYTNALDNPAWVEESGGTTTTTKYYQSMRGALGAMSTSGNGVSVVLTTLNGDIASTVAVPSTGQATGIDGWSDFDEFGGVRDRGDVDALDLGWLGGSQRSADTGGTGQPRPAYAATVSVNAGIRPGHDR